MSLIDLKDMFVLVGIDEPHITFLKGGQWGPELTRSVFKGGYWNIYPNGTFMFQPALMNDARNDLYPIKGICTLVDDTLEFQGKQQSELGASSSLDGTITIQRDCIRLDVIHAVTSSTQLIVRITQVLSFKPAINDEPDTLVPSIYNVFFSGDVDGNPFEALAGSLKLFPPDGADSNPFRVELSTDNTGSIGTMFWTSFLQYPHGQGLQCGTVALQAENQVVLEIIGNNNPLSPSWFTSLTLPYVGNISQGVTAQKGKLTFLLQAEQISGIISMIGKSDLKQTSIYQAQLLGERRKV